MIKMQKYFSNIKAAERFQSRLYEKYNYVRLVESPRWSEEGVYIWEVKSKIK